MPRNKLSGIRTCYLPKINYLLWNPGCLYNNMETSPSFTITVGREPDTSRDGAGDSGQCLHCQMLVYVSNVLCKLF